MSAPVELLRSLKLFQDVPAKELEAIARSFKERRFSAGEVIAEEGKGGIGFFVIEAGRAKVSAGGREVAALGPGSSFGEIALIDDGPRSATVTAETDLRCWGLSAWEFRPIAQTNATIAWNLLQSVVRYIRSAAGDGQG